MNEPAKGTRNQSPADIQRLAPVPVFAAGHTVASRLPPDDEAGAALVHLAHFPGMRQLFLRGCANVTDAGLEHLHGLDALRQLALTDCPQLSVAALAELRATRPRCKIAV